LFALVPLKNVVHRDDAYLTGLEEERGARTRRALSVHTHASRHDSQTPTTDVDATPEKTRPGRRPSYDLNVTESLSLRHKGKQLVHPPSAKPDAIDVRGVTEIAGDARAKDSMPKQIPSRIPSISNARLTAIHDEHTRPSSR